MATVQATPMDYCPTCKTQVTSPLFTFTGTIPCCDRCRTRLTQAPGQRLSLLTPPVPDPREAKLSVLATLHSHLSQLQQRIRQLEEELGMRPARPDLLSLLREIEWAGSDTHHICPICRESQAADHRPSCRMKEVLNDAITHH